VLVDPAQIADLLAQDEPDVDLPTPLWGDVPQACRTCKDFRPSESGARGSCVNKWAFSHRRMVGADEIPCETSIGNWWIPKDDVWLAGAGVIAHAGPTPLVDQWLAHRRATSGQDAVGLPLRRRQRS
jgi:hypothetical protein